MGAYTVGCMGPKVKGECLRVGYVQGVLCALHVLPCLCVRVISCIILKLQATNPVAVLKVFLQK